MPSRMEMRHSRLMANVAAKCIIKQYGIFILGMWLKCWLTWQRTDILLMPWSQTPLVRFPYHRKNWNEAWLLSLIVLFSKKLLGQFRIGLTQILSELISLKFKAVFTFQFFLPKLDSLK